MALYTPAIEGADYTGPSIIGHEYVHNYRLFLPNWKDGAQDPSVVVPPTGFPLILAPFLTAFSTSIMLSQINENGASLYAYLLNAGYAILASHITVSRSDSIGALAPTSGAPYGAAYPGNGVVIPPGITPPGYSGVGVPFRDPLRHNPLKDFTMLCQFGWTLAGQRSDLDQSKMGSVGLSAGAAIQQFVVWGRNRSTDCFNSPSGQETVDTTTILKASIWIDAPGPWWPIYKQDGVGVNSGVRGYMFAKDTGSGFYDQPSVNFEDTVQSWQSAASGINFSQQIGSVASTYPVRMRYSEQGFATNPPYLFDNIVASSNAELTAHSPWNGQLAKAKFPDAVRLVFTSSQALLGYTTTSLHDELILTGTADVQNADVAWLNEQLDYEFPYVPPSGVQSAFTSPTKESTTFVELKWASGFGIARLTDSDNDESFLGYEWTSMTAMDIRYPEIVGTIEDSPLTLELVSDALIDPLLLGSPVSKVEIRIWELTVSDDFPNGEVRIRFDGVVEEVETNADATIGKLLVKARSLKADRDRDLTIPATQTCRNKLFESPCRNPVTGQGPIREDYEETGTIESLNGTRVSISGLSPQGNYSEPIRYWYKGVVEYEGVKVLIRAWNPESPSEFLLARRPPDSWLGKDVKVTPGCARIREQCIEVYSNETNFNAIGYLMTAYDPTSES